LELDKMAGKKLERCREYFRNLRQRSRCNLGIIIVAGFFSVLIFFRKKFGF